MDSTDRAFAEMMIRQWTANVNDLRAEGDADYADIMYALGRLAWWQRKLDAATFGCSSFAGTAR